MSNVGIIGGADGPTAIFVASALPRMLNPLGMAIILLMMIPNVIFALRHRNMENRCKSRFINILEQISRYGCFILMIICIGLDKFGFGSVEDFLIYSLAALCCFLRICWRKSFRHILPAVLTPPASKFCFLASSCLGAALSSSCGIWSCC